MYLDCIHLYIYILIYLYMRDVHNGMGQERIWQVNGDDGEPSKFMVMVEVDISNELLW